MNRYTSYSVIVVAAVAAVLVTFWMQGGDPTVAEDSSCPVGQEEKTAVEVSPQLRGKVGMNPVAAKESSSTNADEKSSPPSMKDDAPECAPAEKKSLDAIQDALDDEDYAKVVAELKVAAFSTNAAVRAKVVEALQWFGQKALPELTLFLADEDEDVRSSATDAWTMGLSQMEANAEKAKTVQLGLSVVRDRGQLELMVMQVDDLSDVQKLDVLSQVIEGKNKPAAEVAREHYKFWTDEEYKDRDAARKWLKANGE